MNAGYIYVPAAVRLIFALSHVDDHILTLKFFK